MSAYSSLCLVANRRVRLPAESEISALFVECGVVNPARNWSESFGLADDLIDFFSRHEARKENDRFFNPDSLSLHMRIQILDPEADYEGNGCSINIHGYGYFFPLEHRDLLAFTNLPKIVHFRSEVERRFGGDFKWPLFRGKGVLTRTLIDSGRWYWFGSQSL